MKKQRGLIRIVALEVLLLGAFAISPALTFAGESPATTPGDAAPPSASEQDASESNAPAPASVKALEAKVSQQQAQIEKLTRAVELLSRRLNETSQTSTVETPHPASVGQVSSLVPVIPGSAATAAPPHVLSVPASPGAAPITQSEMQQYMQRVDALSKTLDGVTKNLGGIKFSGDFRFRGDAQLRSGNDVAGPLQNVRSRYRLRLNLDKELDPRFKFHMQLSTGPLNNGLTNDQDFAGTIAKHPFSIAEAYVDYHPTSRFALRGGRMEEVFADGMRFLWDDDVRFNGFHQIFTIPVNSHILGIKSVEFRSGEYFLSNPNVAILPAPSTDPAKPSAPASAFVSAGFQPGQKVRDSNLFHPGVVVKGDLAPGWSHQFASDIQIFRNPNQIQLASLASGFPVLVSNAFGIALSGPMSGTGNATTTAGGAIFSAPNFQIARVAYRLEHKGWIIHGREMPAYLDFQASRNTGTSKLRDAFIASANLGSVKGFGDMRFLYQFAIKDANALISQFTDDDLGTGSGVNIEVHAIRFDLGLTRFLQWQNLLFIQNQRKSSNPADQLFMPLGRGANTTYRYLGQLAFSF